MVPTFTLKAYYQWVKTGTHPIPTETKKYKLMPEYGVTDAVHKNLTKGGMYQISLLTIKYFITV